MLWNLHEERNLANFPIQKKKKIASLQKNNTKTNKTKHSGIFLTLKLITTKAAGPKAVY